MLKDFSIALTHLNLLAMEMKSFYIKFHFQQRNALSAQTTLDFHLPYMATFHNAVCVCV